MIKNKYTSKYSLTFLVIVVILMGLKFDDLSHFNYKMEYIPNTSIKTQIDEILKPNKVLEGTIREITAYNVGIVWQTDDSPCIGASGDNICQLLDQGVKVCATNFVPLYSELEIENYGRCVVLDRMNSRYKNRVDIAMKSNEVVRAIKFGKQNLKVFTFQLKKKGE